MDIRADEEGTSIAGSKFLSTVQGKVEHASESPCLARRVLPWFLGPGYPLSVAQEAVFARDADLLTTHAHQRSQQVQPCGVYAIIEPGLTSNVKPVARTPRPRGRVAYSLTMHQKRYAIRMMHRNSWRYFRRLGPGETPSPTSSDGETARTEQGSSLRSSRTDEMRHIHDTSS